MLMLVYAWTHFRAKVNGVNFKEFSFEFALCLFAFRKKNHENENKNKNNSKAFVLCGVKCVLEYSMQSKRAFSCSYACNSRAHVLVFLPASSVDG